MANRLTTVRGSIALFGGWLMGVGAAVAQDPYPEPDPAIYGQWSTKGFNLWSMHTTQDCGPGPGIQPCDEIAGVALVASGEKAEYVLYWREQAGTANPTYLWKPGTATHFTLQVRDPVSGQLGNVFCSGHARRPDGTLVAAGGDNPNTTQTDGSTDAWLFDPSVLVGPGPTWNAWSFIGPLVEPRWYPSAVARPNGDVVIFGGMEGPAGIVGCLNPVGSAAPVCLQDSMEFFAWNGGVLGTWVLATQSTVPSQVLELPGADQFASYPQVRLLPRPHPLHPTADMVLVQHEETRTQAYVPGHRAWLLSMTDQNDIVPIAGSVPNQPASFYRENGNSVQVPTEPSRFIQVGGRDRGLQNALDEPGGIGIAQVNDRDMLAAPSANWNETPNWSPLLNGRVYCNTVILPDGSLLTLTGTRFDYKVGGFGFLATRKPERLVPGSGLGWQEMAEETDARPYHSVAILLADGRVLTMGGEFATSVGGTLPLFGSDAQLFSPPYLFRGPRPIIQSAPTQVPYGPATSSLQIAVPPGRTIASIVLIRPGSASHGVEFEQRYVPLSFNPQPPAPPGAWATQTFTVTGPSADPGGTPQLKAQPGYWMLFVVTDPVFLADPLDRGVPSDAGFVRVQ